MTEQPINANAPGDDRGESSFFKPYCNRLMPFILHQKMPNVKPSPAVITAIRLLRYVVSLLVDTPWTPGTSLAVDHVNEALDILQKGHNP